MGHLTQLELCASQQIKLRKLLKMLNKAIAADLSESFDFHSCPSELLAHYLESKHHALIREKSPEILRLLREAKESLTQENTRMSTLEAFFHQSECC